MPGAEAALARVRRRAPASRSAETQAGQRRAAPGTTRMALGAIGVTGTSAANRAAAEADLVIGVGTRLQDFTTGSRALFAGPGRSWRRSTSPPSTRPSTARWRWSATRGAALEALLRRLGGWRAPEAWARAARDGVTAWNRDWDAATQRAGRQRPALGRAGDRRGLARARRATRCVVCAAGGLPGELHKLWRPRRPAATTSSTAFPAWATRSPAGSG